TSATAFDLQFYAAGLIGLAGVEITTRAFYAIHDTRTPVVIATIAMLLHLVMSLVLIRTPLAYGGLALSMSLSSIFEAGALLYMAQRKLGGIGARRIFASFWRSLVAAAIMGAAVLGAMGPLGGLLAADSDLERLTGVVAVICVGAAMYLLAALALRSPEVSLLASTVRQRVGGAGA
ncbi:MAG: lipid II flippase MurJ, partial [Chloroflexota bacterium]